MHQTIVGVFSVGILVIVGHECWLRTTESTADRIASHGYTCETHTVQTSDGYVLTMFRIPYSHQLDNRNDTKKPLAFIMHGLLCSSDSWVLNGPNDGLPFMLADAGYDVWIGNARGNGYSRNHVSMSTMLHSFWEFSWHEIGVFDLPAMIDYILLRTGQESVHYVGHSQGTTVFLVLLSTLPVYNEKIKTSHLLAPIGFLENMQSPMAELAVPYLGHPSVLANLIGTTQFSPSMDFMHSIAPKVCYEGSWFQERCTNILFLFAGWSSPYLNLTLMSDLVATHPAGSSVRQTIHYLQEYQSGFFRMYDYGRAGNIQVYGSNHPPDYEIGMIKPSTPVNFYYSENDIFSDVKDVQHLAHHMGAYVKLHLVKYRDYNHLDFMLAINVKEVIYECVLDKMNEYEGKPFDETFCNKLIY